MELQISENISVQLLSMLVFTITTIMMMMLTQVIHEAYCSYEIYQKTFFRLTIHSSEYLLCLNTSVWYAKHYLKHWLLCFSFFTVII